MVSYKEGHITLNSAVSYLKIAAVFCIEDLAPNGDPLMVQGFNSCKLHALAHIRQKFVVSK